MKIGITRTQNPNKNDRGEPYKYTIHYRDANGVLQDFACTKDCKIKTIIEGVSEGIAISMMQQTDKEAVQEKFLEEI